MEFIFKHTWILFIVVTFINGFILKSKSKKYIDKNPELEEGYNTYFKGWITYGNIPWIIMAIGDLSGLTNNTFDYVNPRTLNPIVLLFHFAILVLWGLAVRWVYFQNGAEFIERHPGLLQKRGFGGNPDQFTAKQVKFFFAIMLLGGMFGMIMMWFINVPNFPM